MAKRSKPMLLSCRIPLFVLVGSVFTLDPQIEYAARDPAGSIEVRIYRSADGKFNICEGCPSIPAPAAVGN